MEKNSSICTQVDVSPPRLFVERPRQVSSFPSRLEGVCIPGFIFSRLQSVRSAFFCVVFLHVAEPDYLCQHEADKLQRRMMHLFFCAGKGND